jgi:hypothetical protein
MPAAQLKAEKIADSEDVGGGSSGGQPRCAPLQPAGSAAQALLHARHRQADSRDLACFPPGAHLPFPPGGRRGVHRVRVVMCKGCLSAEFTFAQTLLLPQ